MGVQCSRCHQASPRVSVVSIERNEEENVLTGCSIWWECCGTLWPVDKDEVGDWCEKYLEQKVSNG